MNSRDLVPRGKVTDDKRTYEVPAMKVCALAFTETARARICKAGGECITFDSLAMRALAFRVPWDAVRHSAGQGHGAAAWPGEGA